MKKTTPEKLKRAGMITVIAAMIVSLIAMPVFAWFYLGYNLAIYAPVSSPESLYIGAGHCDSDHFEEARYIYFDTMEQKLDDEGSGTHWDKVFCVYGKMVSGYRIQLAFTTNKQFTYELYEAEEENEESASTIVTYTTHTDDPTTYYYKIKGDKIEGGYLNQSGTDILADSSLHESTYGDYSVGNVHKSAQPL
ncbi:MAG: hypothetical protein IJ800_06000 [Clostridia bacterium]|nr:hypothetical protein [Clostridia bacterium]